VEKRNADLYRVIAEIVDAPRTTRTNKVAPVVYNIDDLAQKERKVTLASEYDCVILVGDLNYRINGCLKSVIAAIEKNMFEDLMFNDQLRFDMKTGRVPGFTEGHIKFAPTYKRKAGTNNEVSLKRNPSWTDRILYKFNAQNCDLIQKSYDSNNLLTLSDHRPVFSQFVLRYRMKTSEDNSINTLQDQF